MGAERVRQVQAGIIPANDPSLRDVETPGTAAVRVADVARLEIEARERELVELDPFFKLHGFPQDRLPSVALFQRLGNPAQLVEKPESKAGIKNLDSTNLAD